MIDFALNYARNTDYEMFGFRVQYNDKKKKWFGGEGEKLFFNNK